MTNNINPLSLSVSFSFFLFLCLPRSRLMWVHVTLAFLFLPLGILFTRRFSKKLDLKEVTTSASRTLMITRVPRRSCHKDTILKHFQ